MPQTTNLPKHNFKLPSVIVSLLKNRNVHPDNFHDFFSWNLKELPDLTDMNDMSKASQRIIEAIKENQNIGIYGDYDVDGTTACALFFHFFKLLDCSVALSQPSRFTEGYGLHRSSIDRALGQKIDLLITCDCGITDNHSAEYALEKGLDLIITDHHSDIKDEIPKAVAVVNPVRRDEPQESPLKNLAGVGVAFALCLKVKNDLEKSGRSCPSIYSLLQFVAIGTIADLVKLTPLNLKMVRHGLRQMQADDNQYPGTSIFLTREEKRYHPLPSEKIAFNVAPLINSKGRLDHPDIALKLLTANNDQNAREYHSLLEICNRERKAIQAQVFESAQQQVIKELKGENHLISIVYDPSWHEGVIGIVASKLVEAFNVPAIVLTDSDQEGIIKGSARSAGDLNLFECLKQTDQMNRPFIKLGGHKAAAGMSLKKDNLPLLKNSMNEILKDIPHIIRTRQETFDLDISPEEVTPRLLRALESMGPFGQGNPNPIFRMRGVRLDSYDILKEVHVRWSFSSLKNPKIKLKGISFNYINKWGAAHPQKIFHNQNTSEDEVTIHFTLGINRFKGNEYIQLMISKITTDLF